MPPLLATIAAQNPQAPALVSPHATLTYADLLARISRVAGAIARRVPVGGTVATLLPHTPDAAAALLGCHAAGRLVIILSPSDPPARRAAILADAAPDLLLTDDQAAQAAPATLTLAEALADQSDAPLPTPPGPDAPAFVHYTSGSSGQPKGTVIPVRTALSRAIAARDALALGPADTLLAASLPATASGFSFLLASLFAGARALLVDLGAAGAGAMLRLARAAPPTVCVLNAAVTRLLLSLDPAAFSATRHLTIGMMGLRTDELAAWRARLPPGCAIRHTYASTEALVIADWTVPPDFATDEPLLPIGRPVPGIICRLLDPDGAEVPDGTPGELVVHRPDMAIGDWRAGRLVPGRMSPDPDRPGWWVFRTGDLIRRGPDGLLRFAGRVDRQIKINGVRIEPAEIEAALRALPGVTDCVVLAAGPAAALHLHAFIAGDTTAEALHAPMRAALPQTLRPPRITILPALPSLPSGKTDVQALRRLAEA